MAFPAVLLVTTTLVAAAGDKPFKTPEALEAWMVGYHAHPQPARLRGALREAMTFGLLGRPAVLGFFAEAYRADPAAKTALMGGLNQADLVDRMAALFLLRALDEDVTDLLILLPDEYRAKMAACPALPEARTPLLLRPEPTNEEVQKALDRVNQGLGAYRAAGDPAILKVLLEALSGAADHPAFLAWVEAGRKNPNPGPAVARGCVYDQARTCLLFLGNQDPAARKAFKALAVDPTTPEISRTELVRLGLTR
ncbi:MAG TPA: hypothetical protein VJ623_15480 [Holophagaceae bacterium]|nr:hypothetical protein [Holophagaceae bacterium]